MRKTEINTNLREYVKNNLSPTAEDKSLVTSLYDSIKAVLGNSCLLVGSYARFTASKPLHDVDILLISGNFDSDNLHPQTILSKIESDLKTSFKNPTHYSYSISQQTHSITISFKDGNVEKFAVDIVPAFISGSKNEFGDDTYWVPEIIKVGKSHRIEKYSEFQKTKKTEMDWWIKTDPRGYIKSATLLNDANEDFRKATKFVKRWKHHQKEGSPDFKFKSFHIEQVLFSIFKSNPSFTIFDAIFKFFCEIEVTIKNPQIKDRADSQKYIDSYLGELTIEQKQMIVAARDAFLIKLENIVSASDIQSLLKKDSRIRKAPEETYLFDMQNPIPVFTNPLSDLKVIGEVQPRNGGFGAEILNAIGLINVDRRIRFYKDYTGEESIDTFKWKVKNDDDSDQPRGEITDDGTKNEMEHTRYDGDHYVECYAIKNNVCVAKARQNVKLKHFLRR